MELRTGGKMELFFLHKKIAPGETPPEKYACKASGCRLQEPAGHDHTALGTAARC